MKKTFPLSVFVLVLILGALGVLAVRAQLTTNAPSFVGLSYTGTTNFSRTNTTLTYTANTNYSRTNATSSYSYNTNFSRTNATGSYAYNTNFSRTNATGSYSYNTNFSRTNATGSYSYNTNFSRTNATGSYAFNTNFMRTNVTSSYGFGTNYSRTNATGGYTLTSTAPGFHTPVVYAFTTTNFVTVFATNASAGNYYHTTNSFSPYVGTNGFLFSYNPGAGGIYDLETSPGGVIYGEKTGSSNVVGNYPDNGYGAMVVSNGVGTFSF